MGFEKYIMKNISLVPIGKIYWENIEPGISGLLHPQAEPNMVGEA